MLSNSFDQSLDLLDAPCVAARHLALTEPLLVFLAFLSRGGVLSFLGHGEVLSNKSFLLHFFGVLLLLVVFFVLSIVF